MRLTVEGKGGRRVYGGRRPASPERASAPVVRVLGIEAAFTRRSYLPTERMAMRVLADVPSFTLTFLRVGHGPDPSLRNDEMVGLEMGEPVRIDWTGKRSTRQTITVQSGDWPSGLYAARLEADDGRVGFAPFILRAETPSALRVAVVLPTNTWQAYNLYDADGDGWGDTWYAGGRPPVVLDPRRTGTAACRRDSGATTSRFSASSRRPGVSRTSSRTTTSTRSRRATTCARSTTSSCSPGTRSTSRPTRTTSSSGTTPSAAG